MNINVGDEIEAFQYGLSYKGTVYTVHIGTVDIQSVQPMNGQLLAVCKDKILKVNGQVYTDRPYEVYVNEPIETQIHAKAFGEMFDRLIQECDN